MRETVKRYQAKNPVTTSEGSQLVDTQPSLLPPRSMQELFSELKPKQRMFIDEFLVDMNASAAALRCGYSPSNASAHGSLMLKEPIIHEIIVRKLEDIGSKALVTKEYVISGFKEVAQRCMQRRAVMEFDPIERTMIQKTVLVEQADGSMKEEGVWEFDSQGANKALEMLGRHLGLFSNSPNGEDNKFGRTANITVNNINFSSVPTAVLEQMASQLQLQASTEQVSE